MRTARIVAAALALAAASCSSGWWPAETADGDAAVAAASPCLQACCCRTRDSYYVRYHCAGAAECAADAGECLEATIGKCAR